MARYAIIDTQTKTLLTVVEYADAPSTPPPGFDEGVIALQSDSVSGDWTWDGTALQPPPVPTPPPPAPVTQVTPRQARLALLAAGLLDQVEAAVSQIGGATKITWDYATVVDRHDPMISTIGTQLKLSDEQIDALFVYASKQ